MTEDEDQTGGGVVKQRGPSFPFITLEKAVERTRELYGKAKRFEVRLTDAAADWGYRPKSSGAFQTAAALLAYGLIEDSGSGDSRKIKVSEAGWRILEDNRPGTREKLLAEAALKPKLLSEFAEIWRDGRPDDGHAISDLKFDRGFTDESAPRFLRIFDDAVRFTKLRETDTTKDTKQPTGDPFREIFGDVFRTRNDPIAPPAAHDNKPTGGTLMAGERELVTGILSKGGASFRLIVTGKIGEKEIERLIKKLELDKEILADADEDDLLV